MLVDDLFVIVSNKTTMGSTTLQEYTSCFAVNAEEADIEQTISVVSRRLYLRGTIRRR